jgi:hypothetical protein
MGVTNRAATTYRSGAHEFIAGIRGPCCSIFIYMHGVLYNSLSFDPFSVGHFIYSFLLPLWYLQTFLKKNSIMIKTETDYRKKTLICR